MRFKTILILFLFLSNCLKSQTKHEFIGFLKADDVIISYKIDFVVSKSGVLSGESVTDINGPDKTTSIISGTYNSKSKIISFKEFKNSQTKSKAAANSFCFINVKDIQIKIENNKEIILGKFKGVLPNGKQCSMGEIRLVSSDVLNFINEKDFKIDSLKNIETSDLGSLNQFDKKTINLKANDKIDLEWNSTNLIIDVWDNYSEDKDIINVVLNDKKIADHLELKNKHFRISSKINKGTSILKIIAIDEGTTPTNTANILLIDGKTSIPIVARLKKGEVVFIHLFKQ
jgi:hypothetical protein